MTGFSSMQRILSSKINRFTSFLSLFGALCFFFFLKNFKAMWRLVCCDNLPPYMMVKKFQVIFCEISMWCTNKIIHCKEKTLKNIQHLTYVSSEIEKKIVVVT